MIIFFVVCISELNSQRMRRKLNTKRKSPGIIYTDQKSRTIPDRAFSSNLPLTPFLLLRNELSGEQMYFSQFLF